MPQDAGIWRAFSSGSGTQTLKWSVASGESTLVVMNADAFGPVAANAAVGGTMPWIDWLVGGFLVAGGLLLLLALGLILGGMVSVSRADSPNPRTT